MILKQKSLDRRTFLRGIGNAGAANTAGTGDETTAPPPRITIVERSLTVAKADATTVQRVVGGAGSGSLERITEQSML